MNSSGLVLRAWNALLDGTISVPVYKRVPDDAPDNYVWIRIESGFDQSNKRSFNDQLVIITETVTKFMNVGDDSVMEGIDNEIVLKAIPSPGLHGLTNPTGIQILNIKREQLYPPEERDGVNVYLRKISRYDHLIHQTA